MKKCWKCAEEIQDEAISCRFCGADQRRFEAGSNPKVGSSRLPALAIIGAITLGVVYIAATGVKSSDFDRPSDPVEVKSAAMTTAAEMGRTFRENELLATQRFEGAPLNISGKILTVQAGSDAPIVMMDDEAGGMIALKFTPAANADATLWRKGQKIVANCATTLYVLGVITPQDCTVSREKPR